MSVPEKPINISGVITKDLYAQAEPTIDGVKQVLDTLKDRVQALDPKQLQAIGYLEYLQSRSIHGGKKVYGDLIDRVQNQAYRVAPPGFFIRVIEALIPRPMSVDGKTYEKMKRDNDSK